MKNIEQWPELLTVDRPGRYVGGEVEAVPNYKKDDQGRLLHVALCFPDVYDIAHGHLGHKILYSMINGVAGLSAERVYAPWPDWEQVLRARGSSLASLESRRPLKDFHLLGFSLQYELGYSNILNMLELGGVPLLAKDRGDDEPLVVAGGPGAMNPEPLADFFDIFFLGDAEKSFLDDLEIIKRWRFEKAPKSELWERLAGREGIYIPSLFQPVYDAHGRFLSMTSLKSSYKQVTRAVASSLESSHFPVCQITPLIKPVHDRIVLEIGRGCSRGCRFCQAGYVYRPVRERRRETIMELARQNLYSSGQDEVSFLSLSAGDHSQINPMVSGFMDEYAAQKVALSLPSLRVKSLKGHLARQIMRVRKTGFTLAPEAGSQRLRNVINKDLTDDDLFTAASEAFSLGWRTLKLYFMVGLPTETDEDIEAIALLSKRLKRMSKVQINLGVAHFTPKAHTPFQWHPASNASTITERLMKVKDAVKAPGLSPKWNMPGASWVESILARGDRRLGRVLLRVHQAGASFEAWGDRFNPVVWAEALMAEKMDEAFLLNPFGPDDPLPYDHLFAGVNKNFLKKELDKAKRGETSADCRWSDCLACGACHSGAQIDLASKQPVEGPSTGQQEPDREKNVNEAKTAYLINFKKLGCTAFLSHLEQMTLFKRAFRRAGIVLSMSEGFHPQPKMSFLTALPLGVPSEDEYLRIVSVESLDPSKIADLLRPQLPVDIVIKNICLLDNEKTKCLPKAAVWKITSDENIFHSIKPLIENARLSCQNKKGETKIYNLSEYVTEAEASSDGRQAVITIQIGLTGTPKPIAAAAALWGLSDDITAGVSLSKVKTILQN